MTLAHAEVAKNTKNAVASKKGPVFTGSFIFERKCKLMKVEKNILVAFILNIFFSVFEFFGGMFTNSVAILSDAIHDFGDALSIGISYILERKSKKKADEKYTYGYMRYSILGAFITTTILILGSCFVIYESIQRIINPVKINYDGMIVLAIFGTIINFLAAYFTREGDSLNQKAVNLHMLEDVLGWVVVLIGAIIMRFIDISYIDPIMSIGVAIFILINALKNVKNILDLFLEKIPKNISMDDVKKHVKAVDGVVDVHHLHIWSMDMENNYATMHVVINSKDIQKLKKQIREELCKCGIIHTTLEIESENEICDEINCTSNTKIVSHKHHVH